MTYRTLIRRSLWFHSRSHLGTGLGAAVAAAVLIGALVVGDSVRGSLRGRALERLGGIHYALTVRDRQFRAQLADELSAQERRYGPNPDPGHFAPALILPASATASEGSARANRTQLIGVDSRFTPLGGPSWAVAIPPDAVRVNEALATQLGLRVGDTVVLRAKKPSALPQEAILSPRSEAALVLRLQVSGIVRADELGNLSFQASQVPPLNAFVALETLQRSAGVSDRANTLLVSKPSVDAIRTVSSVVAQFHRARAWLFGQEAPMWQNRYPGMTRSLIQTGWQGSSTVMSDLLSGWVHAVWRAEDAQVGFRELAGPNALELLSERVFLDPAVAAAAFRPVPGEVTSAEATRMVERGWTNELAKLTRQRALLRGGTNGQPLLTYLVNRFRAGTNTTPYSMVTAAGPPYTPADLRDDEIVLNDWLADDLRVRPGDAVELTYFDPDSGARLTERTNSFRVRAIVPLEGVHADRTLMPEFPGLAKAESTHDWDAGFPLVHRIREKDEDYWKQHRGTPKAFIALAAGQKMWANRFGSLTAIRYLVPTNSSAAAPREPTLTSSLSPADGGRVAKPGEGISAGSLDPARMQPSMAALREALEHHLLVNLDPSSIGLRFEPVREQAFLAVAQAQDFGQLFLGFSCFLIAAALLLMALLFQFSIEQRAMEVGTLLALGFTPRQVRRLFWLEGGALALVGSLIGVAGGVVYARAMLRGLSTIWRDAMGMSALEFHAEPATLAVGLISAVGIAWLTVGLALRKQARQPARELLAGEATARGWERRSRANEGQSNSERGTRNAELRKISLIRWPPAKVRFHGSWAGWAACGCATALVATALARGDTASAGTFFGAGALLLGAGLAFASRWLRRLERSETAALLTLPALAVRNVTRRRTRSLATIGLFACGSFLIASIGVFRLDAVRDAEKPTSGTGGFALMGESTLPVVQDLNTGRGRDFFALDAQALTGVRFVPLRVRDGDDASCLNLNRAQKPRLLGVNPEGLAGRFTFAKIARGEARDTNAWRLLAASAISPIANRQSPIPEGEPAFRNPPSELLPVSGIRSPASDIRHLASELEIPAIGDAASIQWAMGKQVGDTLDYVNEQGRPFKVRLVGAVANSILQGNLLIDEAAFVRLFPSETGYRMFLVDAAVEHVTEVSGTLSRALRDVGLELTPAARRLAQFNAVQNTYLGTFQVLGGLGLLLGSAGLGVVVLRNVWERRAELALLLAVGFRRRAVGGLVMSEHATLLIVGLGVGLLSAAVAVLPALLAPGTELPYRSLGATVGAVFLSGLVWTWLATKLALGGELLSALRNE